MSFVALLNWLLIWLGVESNNTHYTTAPPPSADAVVEFAPPSVLEASSPPISNGF